MFYKDFKKWPQEEKFQKISPGRIRVKFAQNSRTKNQPKEEGFGTDIPRTSGGHSRGYPSPKLRSGFSKSWKKNKHLGADIHDPKARTSTTPRDLQKLCSEKLWADCSFLKTTEKKKKKTRATVKAGVSEEGEKRALWDLNKRPSEGLAKLPLFH